MQIFLGMAAGSPIAWTEICGFFVWLFWFGNMMPVFFLTVRKKRPVPNKIQHTVINKKNKEKNQWQNY